MTKRVLYFQIQVLCCLLYFLFQNSLSNVFEAVFPVHFSKVFRILYATECGRFRQYIIFSMRHRLQCFWLLDTLNCCFSVIYFIFYSYTCSSLVLWSLCSSLGEFTKLERRNYNCDYLRFQVCNLADCNCRRGWVCDPRQLSSRRSLR